MLSTVKSNFPTNQTSSPSKIGWRANIIASWRATSGLRKLAPGDSLVTLGGPCGLGNGKVIPSCEYDQVVLQEGLCDPHQYVSIEGKDRLVHENNFTIRGPTWIWGDFGESFANWYYTGGNHVALVSADLMNGIDVAIESVSIIFDTIKDNQKRGKFSLVVLNIIERNLRRENIAPKAKPYKYKPVWDTLRDDKVIAKQSQGFIPVNRFSYWSGPHLTSTELTTVVYSYET
jgi:hypothetical protein